MEKLVIGFKPGSAVPLANKSGFPLAMPRPGAKKVARERSHHRMGLSLDPGRSYANAFSRQRRGGDVPGGRRDLRSKTPTGEITLNQYKAGTIRFNARDRVHTEELTRGTERAIIVELK